MATCKRGHVGSERYANGVCKQCMYGHNRDNRQERYRRESVQVRAAALRAYGGKCACCGEDQEVFLVIDHIDGGGGNHRRSILNGRPGGGGYRTYRWLRQQGYPPGFQVLCANCNMAKDRPGGCPHQKDR